MTKLIDSTEPAKNRRPCSTPRAGFIVARRVGKKGTLQTNSQPFEHRTAAAACQEAQALADRHQAEFSVFQEIGSTGPSNSPVVGNA